MKRWKKAVAALGGLAIVCQMTMTVPVYADDVSQCEEHVYDYDCDTICNICGYERTASHTYDSYATNYNTHWKVCECGAKLAAENHVYDDETDLTCNVCGYVRHLEHSYTIAGADREYHWTECECGETTEKEAHSFTQNFNETWHWLECSCGSMVDYGSHVWGEGSTDNGVTTYTCSICGAQKTEGTPTDAGTEQPSGGDETPGDGNENGSGAEAKGNKLAAGLFAAIGIVVLIWGGAVAGFFVYRKRQNTAKETLKENVKDTL